MDESACFRLCRDGELNQIGTHSFKHSAYVPSTKTPVQPAGMIPTLLAIIHKHHTDQVIIQCRTTTQMLIMQFCCLTCEADMSVATSIDPDRIWTESESGFVPLRVLQQVEQKGLDVATLTEEQRGTLASGLLNLAIAASKKGDVRDSVHFIRCQFDIGRPPQPVMVQVSHHFLIVPIPGV